MFAHLTRAITGALSRFNSSTVLGEADLAEGLREIRRALLEADVSLELVGPFLERVRTAALGSTRVPGVQAGQQVVAEVHQALVDLLGPVDTRIPAAQGAEPTVVLVMGLQGSGKTTSCAKLASWLARKKQRRPLLVAADLQRPAAEAQLRVLAAQAGLPVIGEGDLPPRGLLARWSGAPRVVEVCRAGVARARAEGRDLVVIDTAGRLHVDEALMTELQQVVVATRPSHRLLVCDALSGQDALRAARAFGDRIGVDGVVLTKLDGDARGGAALSVKAATGAPLQFLGTGERLDDIEPHDPRAMADRILDRGDVVRLVELARENADQAQAGRSLDRLRAGKLGFDDLLAQLRTVQRIGLGRLLALLPGGSALAEHAQGPELARVAAIIGSMTPRERRDPSLLGGTGGGRRRRRIAAGSGRPVQEVNRLVREFKQLQRVSAGLLSKR